MRNTVCITFSRASTVTMGRSASGLRALYTCCFKAGRHITSLGERLCACKDLHIHVHVYTYVYVHVYAHIHACNFTYVHIHVHVHVHRSNAGKIMNIKNLDVCIHVTAHMHFAKHTTFVYRRHELSGVYSSMRWGGRIQTRQECSKEPQTHLYARYHFSMFSGLLTSSCELGDLARPYAAPTRALNKWPTTKAERCSGVPRGCCIFSTTFTSCLEGEVTRGDRAFGDNFATCLIRSRGLKTVAILASSR